MEFNPTLHAQLMLVVLRRLIEERGRVPVLLAPPIMVLEDDEFGITSVAYTDTVTFLNPSVVDAPVDRLG